MKILLVSTLRRPVRRDVFASRSRVIYQLADGLQKHGHEITLLGTGDSKIPNVKIIPVIEKALINLPPVENDFLETVAFQIQQAKKMIEIQDEFDIIHNHSYPDFFPHILENELRKPLITTLHAVYDKAYMDQTLSLFKKSYFIALSEGYTKLYEKTKFFSVVYNGIDPNLYKYEKNKDDYIFWLGRLPLGRNGDGTFMDPKGVKTAIRLAQRTGKRLLLAGAVENPEFFKRDVEPYLNNQISWVGNVSSEQSVSIENAVEYMQKAKVFLMTVDQPEPFGLVMAESMSCGTPVVGIDRGSVSEVVEDGKTGFVVPPEKGVEGLIQAVNNIYDMSAQEYNKMSKNARARVENNFTIDRMVLNYEATYAKILAS